jgi:U4/U6 small nuclear ribonucleoprotein PRP31
VPQQLTSKAVKLISGKLVLAARYDLTSPNTKQYGLAYRSEIENKLQKLQEPPPKKQKKALPVPLDSVRKKRGGRRYRAMRDRQLTTELGRLHNRVEFVGGGDDYGDEEDMGMLSVARGARVQDTQKLSKRAERTLKQTRVNTNHRILDGSLTLADPLGIQLPPSSSSSSSTKQTETKKYF